MTALLLVTLVSILLAIVMGAIAWRASGEERRRADARVASLAADIQDAVAASSAVQSMPQRAAVGLREAQADAEHSRRVGMRGEPATVRPIRPVVATSSDLFTATDPAGASSRSVIVVGIGLFAIATLAALAVVFSSGSRPSTDARGASSSVERRPTNSTAPAAARTASSPAQTGVTPQNPVPLELVALGQERDGDRLVVRGVLRNPSAGTRVEHVIAVVFLFDRDGGFLTSGRAAIDSTTVVPGGESTFLITVPGAASVARYRVSFRTENAVIPHVDKRHG